MSVRTQVNLLVAATTSLVLIAFLVPLGLVLRAAAEQRALSEATQQAQSAAALVALGIAVGSAVAFNVSMANRAASNASARCGADTATITDASPVATSPIRCKSTMRPSSAQRARASVAMARNAGSTCSS